MFVPVAESNLRWAFFCLRIGDYLREHQPEVPAARAGADAWANVSPKFRLRARELTRWRDPPGGARYLAATWHRITSALTRDYARTAPAPGTCALHRLRMPATMCACSRRGGGGGGGRGRSAQTLPIKGNPRRISNIQSADRVEHPT